MTLFGPHTVARLYLPHATAKIFEIDDHRQLIFQTRSHKQTFSLADSDMPPEFTVSKLWLVRLNPKTTPFLVANLGIVDTSGGLRSVAYVFHISPNKAELIDKLCSNQAIRAIHHDGKSFLIRSYEIGENMGHAEMPRWEELFDIQHNQLHQLKHAQWFYKPWRSRLWGVLKQHPDDLDTWAYNNICLTYEGIHANPAHELHRLKHALLRSPYPYLASRVPRFTRWPKPDSHPPENEE